MIRFKNSDIYQYQSSYWYCKNVSKTFEITFEILVMKVCILGTWNLFALQMKWCKRQWIEMKVICFSKQVLKKRIHLIWFGCIRIASSLYFKDTLAYIMWIPIFIEVFWFSRYVFKFTPFLKLYHSHFKFIIKENLFRDQWKNFTLQKATSTTLVTSAFYYGQ